MSPEMLNTIAQILTQLVAFLIFAWILKKFAWGPIVDLLDERRERVTREFEEIEKKRAEADSLRENYEERIRKIEQEARDRIQDAVAEGRKVAQEIREQAHQEAREITNKAKENIQMEVDKARIQMKEDMVRMTMEALERVMREAMDREQHEKLIAEFIENAGKN